MAVTTYTYSVADDTANGAVHPRSLDAEIRASTIVTALDGIATAGDVLSIKMKDALSSSDETTLDGLVEAHQGVVTVNLPPPTNSKGAPVFQPDWREGSACDFITFNWCDRTSWYPQSTRVTDETLADDGDGVTFNSDHEYWIDVTHGRITHEHRLADSHGVAITVDDVTKTESSPGTTDGDFQIDYDTGVVTFNASQAGKTVKATYSYATNSVFYVEPDEGRTVRLTAVEVQFTADVEVNDSAVFSVEGFVEVFAPQLVNDVDPDYVTSFPTGTRIPLDSPRIYKTMYDYIAEAQRSYPSIPAIGGSSWRGMAQAIHLFRWPYQEDATRDLVASQGMRIKICLENDEVFGGTMAVATLYAVSTNNS